ncbi:LacI family DNA-binding transcriptional regulator [Altererythrobacter indicus]|uniref:LacI family DNA-binding transcriptional regulator n=2 Tax=Altericroceibacterium indicum TaxID=374177 RepID=A0A845ACU7_9SPHN|nr:LacI family DNA-binding transcriptional regulator [Altericroceibacterium indicum]
MVAQQAGVSPMTVSNVLNDKANVTKGKREAVMKAVRELGYQPNRAARALASATSLRIGLLHRDMDSSLLGQLLLGTLRAANLNGAEIAIRSYDPDVEGSAYAEVQTLVRSGVDGLILPPPLSEDADIVALKDSHHLPMIALAPGSELGTIPSVGIDDEQASYELTRLIVNKGHTRIGFVRFVSSNGLSQTREAGYLRALKEAGLKREPELIWAGRPTYEQGLLAAEYFLGLAHPPTAIFCSSDDIAAAIVNYAHRQGLRIPGDLSVAGFDDAPIASQTWPQLTTVRQAVSNIAEIATDRLLKALKSRSELLPETQWVAHQVIERQSIADLRR